MKLTAPTTRLREIIGTAIAVVLLWIGARQVIVDKTANLGSAAKKIAWGKLFNSGQSCVAPDYLYVHESVADAFTMSLASNLLDQGIREMAELALTQLREVLEAYAERDAEKELAVYCMRVFADSWAYGTTEPAKRADDRRFSGEHEDFADVVNV